MQLLCICNMYIYEYYERELRIIVTTTLRQLSGNQKKKKNYRNHERWKNAITHMENNFELIILQFWFSRIFSLIPLPYISVSEVEWSKTWTESAVWFECWIYCSLSIVLSSSRSIPCNQLYILRTSFNFSLNIDFE